MQNFEQFIGSFSFDKRLGEVDIIASIAHTKMLMETSIINTNDGDKIIFGLNSILKDLQTGWSLPEEEDIHYALEKELIRRIGEVGGRMHTARSRNDQVATDLRMYVKQEINTIESIINKFQKILVRKAEENIDVVMPGFTHLQPAQPILAAHYLLAYAWMLDRDKQRLLDCYKRTNVLPLGSAALAGTSFPIDRNFTAKLLGFESVTENSLDAVSDRDFAIEFVFCMSMIALHLTRFCEEIILWMNPEFAYITLDDKFTSGSSIMPQKRNPDCAEVIRGKSGRVFGDLIALLTVVKSLPLAYNRDLQEDKSPVFDAFDSMRISLEVIVEMVESLKFVKENTRKSTEKGFIAATEIADYLTKQGMPFRTAHGIVKNIVLYCQKNNKTLNNLSFEEYNKFSCLFRQDIFEYLDAGNIANMKTSYGATSKKSITLQIQNIKRTLK
ncbi:MAG: argininosuccinate lyase [Endomicrobium sp.]|jgi:argininosuccinate lyase|uniref:argininosuccinate lyase n=1 Tax=Candidatus Endomicrobiellum cubanum TaxID=3242325 RepID=UPI002833B92D|nr:argininosuccinate lyase [Endomicrobium sp.]MDR2395901.1 argininosuccinate lyase [Endomicrobium sp.]